MFSYFDCNYKLHNYREEQNFTLRLTGAVQQKTSSCVCFNTQNKMGVFSSKHNNSTQLSAPYHGYMFASFLDHIQANIFKQKVHSVRTVHYGTLCCLQGVRKKIPQIFKFKALLNRLYCI